jgi:biotin synthase
MEKGESLPELIRVSAGSAVVLGLLNARIDTAPTTIYVMTFFQGKCNANCGFCPQARESRSRNDMLSRVSWPVFSTKLVFDEIRGAFEGAKMKRVCIQALNYPDVFHHLLALLRAILEHAHVPISVSCQPLRRESIVALAEAGAERIGIPLDAATEEIFTKIKGAQAGGPYRWENQLRLLREAVDIFGKGKVSTHLIVGLGETQREMVKTIQECVDMNVLPGLFAFTPISGTTLADNAPPTVEAYRQIQLARYLILNRTDRFEEMSFDEKGNLINFSVDDKMLMKVVDRGEPFVTSGCPGCNRPYYNEKPSGPIYNYPRNLTQNEISQIKMQLHLK